MLGSSKEDTDKQISARSKSRSITRALKKSMSRTNSQVSCSSGLEEEKSLTLGRVGGPRDSSSISKIDGDEKQQQQKIIEEQDVEDSLPNEEEPKSNGVRTPLAQRKSLTLKRESSSQPEIEKQATQVRQRQMEEKVNRLAIRESQELLNEESARTYVGAMLFGGHLECKALDTQECVPTSEVHVKATEIDLRSSKDLGSSSQDGISAIQGDQEERNLAIREQHKTEEELRSSKDSQKYEANRAIQESTSQQQFYTQTELNKQSNYVKSQKSELDSLQEPSKEVQILKNIESIDSLTFNPAHGMRHIQVTDDYEEELLLKEKAYSIFEELYRSKIEQELITQLLDEQVDSFEAECIEILAIESLITFKKRITAEFLDQAIEQAVTELQREEEAKRGLLQHEHTMSEKFDQEPTDVPQGHHDSQPNQEEVEVTHQNSEDDDGPITEDQLAQPYSPEYETTQNCEEERMNGLAEDAVELFQHYLFKEEFKFQVLLLEKAAVELIQDKTVQKTENLIIDELVSKGVSEQTRQLQEQCAENLISQAQDKVVARIIEDFMILFELSTLVKTSDNVANMIENALVSSLVDLAVDHEEHQKVVKQPSLKVKKPGASLPPAGKGSRLSQSKDKIRVIKKKDFKPAVAGPLSKKDSKQQLSGRRNHQQSPRQHLVQYDKGMQALREMKIDDLLDINFFEKCFFGKNTQLKDQLVFRIYAKELLDLIKGNLSKQIKKKLKKIIDPNKRQKKKNYTRKIRSNSPPRSQQLPLEADIKSQFSRSHSLTPTLQKRRDKQNAHPEQRKASKKSRTPGLHSLQNSDEKKTVKQPKSNGLDAANAHFRISFSGQDYQNLVSTAGTSEKQQQPRKLRMPIVSNQTPGQLQQQQMQSQQQSILVSNEEEMQNFFSNFDPSADDPSRMVKAVESSQQNNEIYFSSSTLNPADYEQRMINKKIKKKRQPSQAKFKDKSEGDEVSVNAVSIGGATIGTTQVVGQQRSKTPMRRLNELQQVRVFQNLETQLKDIVNHYKPKNSGLQAGTRGDSHMKVKSLKVRKPTAAFAKSEQVSPTNSKSRFDQGSEMPSIVLNDSREEMKLNEPLGNIDQKISSQNHSAVAGKRSVRYGTQIRPRSKQVPPQATNDFYFAMMPKGSEGSGNSNFLGHRGSECKSIKEQQQYLDSILAIGTPKRQIAEVLDSARKFVKAQQEHQISSIPQAMFYQEPEVVIRRKKQGSKSKIKDHGKLETLEVKRPSDIITSQNESVLVPEQELMFMQRNKAQLKKGKKLSQLMNQTLTAQNSPTEGKAVMNKTFLVQNQKRLDIADLRLIKQRRPIATLIESKQHSHAADHGRAYMSVPKQRS